MTLILGAAYTLWMVKRVIFGPVANSHVAELTDLNGREFLVLGVLAVAVLLLGVYPAPLLNIMEVSVHHLSSRPCIPSCRFELTCQIPQWTWASVAPASGEIFLVFAICAVLLIDVFAGEKRRGLAPTLTLIVLAITAALLVGAGQVGSRVVLFDGLYVADPVGCALKLAALLSVAIGLLYSRGYMGQRGTVRGEYYVLALTALLGIFVLASANTCCWSTSGWSCWRCRSTPWWPSTATMALPPRRQ